MNARAQLHAYIAQLEHRLRWSTALRGFAIVTGGAYLDSLRGGAAVSNPLEGTTYTPKVLTQMEQDLYHGFPSLIDSLPTSANASSLVGEDGIARTMVRLPGSINGVEGDFEWLIERDGMINHRFFNAG